MDRTKQELTDIISSIFTKHSHSLTEDIMKYASSDDTSRINECLKSLKIDEQASVQSPPQPGPSVSSSQSVHVVPVKVSQFVLPETVDKLPEFFHVVDEKLRKKETDKVKYFNLLSFKVITENSKVLSGFKNGKQTVMYKEKSYNFAGPPEKFTSEEWKRFKGLLEKSKESEEEKPKASKELKELKEETRKEPTEEPSEEQSVFDKSTDEEVDEIEE